MNEQLLKDFIATAQKYNYNWNTVFGKFPELKGYDQQLLKDYVATAEKNNYDYDVVNSKFPELGFKQEPLKKKESTDLGSKSGKPTSVSSTKPVKADYDGKQLKPKAVDYSKYQKVGDKYYDGQGEIFTDYPGKEGKPYRYNNGQWFEYSSTLNVGGTYDKPVEQLKQQIKDPMRIAALNKQYGKQAGPEKNVYVGYPGKEQNEYKFENNNWYKRTPENKTWVTVANESSITALNNHFKKTAEVIKDPSQINKIKQDNQYSVGFDKNLKNINASLIGGTEETAVQRLQRLFPSSNGWRFEEAAGTGDDASFLDADRVKITAPNGQRKTFYLDNWTWDEDNKNANDMKTWMASNNLTPSEYQRNKEAKAKLAEEQRFTGSTSLGDKEAMAAQKVMMEKNLSDALGVSKPFDTEEQRLLKKVETAKAEAVPARLEFLTEKSRKAAEIQSKYQQYLLDPTNLTESQKREAQMALGALAEDKSVIYQSNKFVDDIKNNAESYKKNFANAEIYVSQLSDKLSSGEINQEEFNAQVKAKRDELSAQESDIKSQIKLSDKVASQANQAAAENLIIKASEGTFGGGVALSAIKGAASPIRLLTGAIGEGMTAEEWHNAVKEAVSPFWDFGTSLEYLRSEERPDLYKAAFSVAESLGAMAPAALTGAGTLLGTGTLAKGTMGAATFFPMSYYEMKDELEGVDMPESHKMAMSAVYGAVSGALESIGMEYAIGKLESNVTSAIKRNILKNVLSKELPKNAPKEFIDALIRTETKAYLGSLGLGTLGAGVVEGATESIQSLVGSGIKEIYDRVGNKTELFNNEGIGEIVKGALYEGYLGALGGGMVHSVYVASDATRRQRALNSKELNMLLMSAKTNGMDETLMTNLKADLLNGRITKAEAQEIAQNFDMVRGNVNQMPTNLTPEAQSVSLGLMMERDRLNKQKDGKDPNLVKPITDRINEINNRLEEIAKENAVQEQSTGEVPVQSETGVSGKVEEGVSEAKPEGVTGETITEEVKVEEPKGEQPQAEVTQEEVVQSEENQALIDDYVQEQTNLINELYGDKNQEAKQEVLDELTSDPIAYANERKESESASNFLNSLQRQPATQETVVAEKLTVNPSEGYSFEYESENDIPAELKGVEPTGRTETKVGRGKNAKTKLKLTFTGQQLIDVGLAVTPEAQAEVVQPVVQETVQTEAQAEPTAKIETIEVEEVPQVEQSLNDLTQQNNVLTENDFTAARIRNVGKEKVVAQIAKAAKAIAKVLPKVKIIVHATPEAFVEATKDMDGRLSEGGLYDRKTGEIHINLEKATNRTVAHEVFHALILSMVKSDVEAQRLTRSMIKSVIKSLKKAEGTAELISYLEEFESNYDDNIKDEEKLGELFGILADNYKQLPPASKNIIIRFLNRLAKAFGLKEMTDREAIEFMNNLSRKVEMGQEIEAREVGKQKEGKAAVRKQKGDVVKSKINEDFEHTITLNGKDIGKIFYDRSQKTWNNLDFDMRGVTPYSEKWIYGDVVGENKQEAIDEMVRRYKEKEVKPTAKAEEAKIKYTNDQVTNNFLNALNEKSDVSRNPINNKEFIYGDKASLEFSRFDKGDRNEIAIQSISTFDKGKGVGKQVMKDITDTADELGVTLTLDAKPFGNEGLSKEQLINFYKKNGFVANIEEMFGGEFESEEELIDYVINEEPETALQMTREPSTREFAVRKQKTTGPSRIVENGVNAGKTDAEIRQEGRAAGFTNKEMTEALSKHYTKEQGIFMKSGIKGKVGQFVDFAKRWKQKYLTTKGLLAKVGFTYKEKMEGEISAEANRAAKTAKKFGVMFDKFTGDKDLLKDAFDKVLRGDKSIQLPTGFAGLANEMRNHIDRLSQMLIDSGAVDADMADTIRKNIGAYITRSYEIFDNKNFRQKIGEQELQSAKNFLRTQPGMIELAKSEAARTNVTVDEALDALVDNKIDEYFADAETGALIKGSKLGSKDLSTLKERKEIPEQIRMLMGEYSDPAMNYARTVLNIATLAARHQFLTQVKEAGMGKFFFEKNDSQRPKGFDTEIAAEGSETMSPLNGLMTTPEIAEAFGLYNGQKGEDSWYSQLSRIYYKAMALVKWLKTIASFGTHAKNVFSNFGFVGLNGHSLTEIGKAIKIVAQDLKTMSKPEIEAKIDEYIKAGIMRQGAGINEIKDMFKDADMDDFLERRLSTKKPKGIMGKIKQVISSKASKLKTAMEDLYQAEDDMFKIAAYETEMNRYADALYNKSKDQLTDKERQEVSDIAANNVKNTYPTYSRIPEGIKQLRKFPLFIGSFISFQAESYRTAFNTIALAKNELSSDNKKIKAIGARRIAGAGAYLTAKTALLSYAGYAAGTGLSGVLGSLFNDDDEEKKEKDVRSFLPSWSKNSDLIVLKAADGEIEYIDFSASDPHGGINKALNAFLNGEDLLDSFKQSTLELVGQFEGPDILTNLAIQLNENKNDFGKDIYNEQDTFQEKTDKILDYVYKVIEPGTFTSVRKGINSEQPLGQLAFGEATGLKIRKSDVKDQFGYKLADFEKSFEDSRKIYNSEYNKTVDMLDNPKATEKEIEEQKKITEDALVRANDAYAAKAKELMDLINSANKLGVDYDELIDELEFIKSTMGKAKIREMEKGGNEFIKEKRY